MKTTTTAIMVLIIAGCTIAAIEGERSARRSSHLKLRVPVTAPMASGSAEVLVRASGRIEGLTEQVEIRARVAEQIHRLHAIEGQRVKEGDLLVELDSEQLMHQRQLAEAQLRAASARLDRVQNGFRDSEIDAGRSQYDALVAELEGAQKNLTRAERLVENDAGSQQVLDDHFTRVTALQGQVAAAKARLETLEAPPRNDDLNAAMAEVSAAQSQLAIAETNLKRTRITAPIAGRILDIDGEIGELTGPGVATPLIILADTTQFRVMAEIDEYDALRIELGQRAFITADSTEGVLAEGEVVEIDPLMNPKQTFGQWAGERKDAYTRPVWIRLDGVKDLPVGLPVDVYIRDDQ